jgi:N-hydroxyarylamine O-acetyltransferase
MEDYQFPIDEYCDRINVSQSGKPTLDRFADLQQAQIYTVPFENLDIQLGRGLDLTPNHVDDKVIRSRRGGYCFELNGLFLRALDSAGYEARRALGRVHGSDEPSGRCHQVSLVKLGGRYWLADVVFGGHCPREPIPLEFDTIHDHGGVFYRLLDHELGYLLQKRTDEDWQNLYSFDLSPVVSNDIAVANYLTSTNPETHFTRNRIAVLAHPEGETRLVNYRCTAPRGGKLKKERLPDSEQYLEELKQRFGINLNTTYNQLRPVETDT